MSLVLALLLVLWLVVGMAGAQQPPAPSCEEELAQALQRSVQYQGLAGQEREAIARYFQREITKLRGEIEALKAQKAEKGDSNGKP